MPRSSAHFRPTPPSAGGLRRCLVAVALATLVLGSTSFAQSPSGISVTGSGSAYGEPDQAVIQLGVSIAAEAVRDAISRSDALMQAVHDALLGGGVVERDLRTIGYNVWRQDLYGPDGEITGERYHVEHQYEVVVRDVSRVGQLLSSAVEAGANSVGGITYTISNPDELRAQAREAAMRDAEAKASQLAELAGVRLGAAISISESSPGGVGPQYEARYSAMGAGGGAPVSGGQLVVEVDVSVVYDILGAD